MDFVKYVSHLIENQFPSVFRNEGEELVSFVKAYYEWFEEEYLEKGKSLTSFSDIDDTLSEYINHFVAKYMHAIPENILQDKRMLQKHILDLYRSKGSQESIRLLFRLLFDEEIDLYVPAKDIFKTSDGVWVEKKYLEVSYSPRLKEFIGMSITGVDSGARAFVESYERRLVNGRYAEIFFIENIRGNFNSLERIRYDDNSEDLPYIEGSVTTIDILSSFNDFKIGDILEAGDSNVIKTRVTALKTTGDTVIDPRIIRRGSGYTMNAEVTISSGSNTSGTGFDFRVSSLSNTSLLTISNEPLNDLLGINLSAFDYGLDTHANSSIPFSGFLNFQTVTIGAIESIEVLNPGTGYDGNVVITVTDPLIAPLSINDGRGGKLGNNAFIRGDAAFGENLISSLYVIDSGINFEDGEIIELQHNASSKKAQGIINKTPIGRAEGYYIGNNGNLSSNKYLQDSYYYQEFSYEIITRQTLDYFKQILIDSVHPAGNEVFAKFSTADSFIDRHTIQTETRAEGAFWFLGAITDLNFETNRYLVANEIRQLNFVDNEFHTRSGNALKFNPTLMQYDIFGNSALRRHGDGYLSEPIRLNEINTGWTSSSIPNTWTISTNYTSQVNEVGDEAGVKYVELRLFGTSPGNTEIVLFDGNVGSIEHAASVFTNSSANTGLQAATMKFIKEVGGSPIETLTVPLNISNQLLSETRQTIVSFVEEDIDNVKIVLELQTVSTFVDILFRIGSPQFEQGGYVSTPIRETQRNSDSFEMSSIETSLNHTHGAMFWKGKILGSSIAYNSQIITFETTSGLIQFEIDRNDDIVIRLSDDGENHYINNSNSDENVVVGISWNPEGAIGKIGNNPPVSISNITFSPSIGINVY